MLVKCRYQNYDKVKNMRDFNLIYAIDKRGKIRRSKTRPISSFKLVKLLLNNESTFLNKLVFSNELEASAFYDTVKTIDHLEYSEELMCQEVGEGRELLSIRELTSDMRTKEVMKRLDGIYKSSPEICDRYLGELEWYTTWVSKKILKIKKFNDGYNKKLEQFKNPSYVDEDWMLNNTYTNYWLKRAE